ncbi:hypothetical protein QJS04_geneDACA005982 [Acorus gramineus]|uniref:mannosyl-glycoprotein endo-beta-N-acetylglucosaminidase n=1 Tax=Acorus gramineus TaxID=55184 RepID=A0AAV9B1S4_ACOGR|nr:hypothetical protein QJS04_geneDACA005982 [Acorus gramineus]
MNTFFTTLKNLFNLLLSLLSRLIPSMANPKPDEPQSPTDPPPPPPPAFDPSKPSVPISYPIKDLKSLESRSYFESFHYPFNKSSVPLPAPDVAAPDRPRMLVCHDMMGGYADDKWVQGGSNAEAYGIWHWHLIDVFVYFSHNLVSVPPPCWTNAAHTHGVKVLGTFLVEWDEGIVIADKLLSTKESAILYAERLTELADALGFDGWLINMEVKLKVDKIPILKEFVNHLTQTMHASVEGSLVIWYDSVTKDGLLRYQNELNENNKPFFDLCDGLFANYFWQKDSPKRSASFAGARKFDVYMGIDVFGRGTYGGGEWNTHVALDVLKKDNVSAALFAPGWVYESKQGPDFETAQNRWWGLVEKSWGILRNYPKVVPFYSNFDQGHGYHVYIEGSQAADVPWNNLSSQTFQPVLDNNQRTIKAFINFKDAAYTGGANITFEGNLEDNATLTTRLFRGKLHLEDLPLHITYSVMQDGKSRLGLSLGFSKNSETKSILLTTDAEFIADQLKTQFDMVINPVLVKISRRESSSTSRWILKETTIKMRGYTLNEINVLHYSGKDELHDTILETDLRQQGTKTVSVKMAWKLEGGDNPSFVKYNIYVGKSAQEAKYLGVAKVRAFYVSDLVVVPGVSNLIFFIQVCSSDGTSQELDSSPTYKLAVKG